MNYRIAGSIIAGVLLSLSIMTFVSANDNKLIVEYLKEPGQQLNDSIVASDDQSFVPATASEKMVNNYDMMTTKMRTFDSTQVEVYYFKEGEGEQKVK